MALQNRGKKDEEKVVTHDDLPMRDGLRLRAASWSSPPSPRRQQSKGESVLAGKKQQTKQMKV
jgi:hypothetical protein